VPLGTIQGTHWMHIKKPLGTPRSPHLLPKENFGPLVCMLDIRIEDADFLSF